MSIKSNHNFIIDTIKLSKHYNFYILLVIPGIITCYRFLYE